MRRRPHTGRLSVAEICAEQPIFPQPQLEDWSNNKEVFYDMFCVTAESLANLHQAELQAGLSRAASAGLEARYVAALCGTYIPHLQQQKFVFTQTQWIYTTGSAGELGCEAYEAPAKKFVAGCKLG